MSEMEKVRKAPLFHPTSRRFHLILLLITGFCCTTFMRMQIALTMTCMVNSTAVSIKEDYLNELESNFTENSNILFDEMISNINNSIIVNDGDGCTANTVNGKHVVVDYGGTLVWTHQEQNIIFSGTFWGAIIICLPGMIIVQRGSPRLVFLGAMLIYVGSSLITPYLAMNIGYFAVFLCRVFMGFGEGVVIPSINSIIALWFPMEERSTALALFTTGNQLAAAAGNPLAAAMCASRFGWQSIFYICGIAGCVWSVVWVLTSSNQPRKCKVMTKVEREYLLSKMEPTNKKTRTQNVPYMKVLTSPAFLAQLQCHFVTNSFITLFQIYLPSYLKDVLRMGVMANGIFIAIPNIFNFVFKIMWGLFMDKLKEKKCLSPTAAVKLSQGVANFGSSICLLVVGYFINCSNKGLGLILFILTFMVMGTFTSGFYTSLLSLAPRYTATLSSISQFFAMLGRLSTPFIVGLVKTSGSDGEWSQVFYIYAVMTFVSGAIFVLFGSGDVQDWGKDDDTKLVPPEEILELVKRQRTESFCE